LAELEVGTHLFCPAHGNMIPLQVVLLDHWPMREALNLHYPPIVRLYAPTNALDLRTGLVAPMNTLHEALSTMTLSMLSFSS
jgi:hypothetical protein